jgi:CRISPR-associated protein Csx17
MNEIVLEGCTPTPLASYLKALGVLRLVSIEFPETRGFWRNDQFVLLTSAGREEIERFFLEQYEPTPVMAPWNGGSGFYEKDNKVAMNAILQSAEPRFRQLQDCLRTSESALTGINRDASPKGDDKATLLTRIRAWLPDAALDWFDASVLLSGGAAQYPPLLGTGGNDGRLDFTNNFMQRLLDVIGPGQEHTSRQWLATALFAEPAPNHVKSAIGQFAPGHAGGPNSTAGFDADASINPWDFVLMIEGALLFAAAAVRRNADDAAGLLSYPFTVRAVSAGSGNLGEGDTSNARGELWMPLWSQPATFPEIRALLAEGRVSLDGKPVRDALDFVRAAHRLGTYRGIKEFQRYGLLMRSGKAYLATPLSRVTVTDNPAASWLDDLDKHQWLDRFRRFGRGANTANRFLVLRKRLEDRLFALSGRRPSQAEAQALLILLGEIQTALAASPKAREEVPPIPHLSEPWIVAADDASPAFRIAKALAGLKGTADKPLPLRAQLFPVHSRNNTWMEDARKAKDAGNDPYCHVRVHTGLRGNLPDSLHALLERRLWLAEKLEMSDKPLDSPAGTTYRPDVSPLYFRASDKPLDSPAGATLPDIAAFLRDDRMDARIAELLPGLALCTIPQDQKHAAGEGVVPAAFALLKLILTPDRTLRSPSLKLPIDDVGLPVPPGMLAQLDSGNHGNRAIKIAWRRLRASGLAPVIAFDNLPNEASINPQRAAAALLIPLRFGATAALAHTVLKQPKTETA